MSEFSPDSSSVAEIKSELDGIKQILKSVTSTGGSGLRLAPNGPIGSPIPSPVPLPVPVRIQDFNKKIIIFCFAMFIPTLLPPLTFLFC